MALQWSTTRASGITDGFSCLVHGRAKSGKTTLIGTAPRPIIASAEGGTLSLGKQDIPKAEIRNLADFQDFYTWCTQSAEVKNFDTICLDSLTEIAERILSDEKKNTKDPRQAYGAMSDIIAVKIRQFRDLPKNVYFSAQSELIAQPDGSVLYSPAMPGKKTANSVAYHFDEVFFIGLGETQGVDDKGQPTKVEYRYLMTHQNAQYECGDRSGSLDMMEPPDLTHVFTKIWKSLQPK